MVQVNIVPIAISVREATRVLGLGRTRIYELIKSGEITAKKDGKRTLLMMESLRAYIAALPAASCQGAAKGRE